MAICFFKNNTNVAYIHVKKPTTWSREKQNQSIHIHFLLYCGVLHLVGRKKKVVAMSGILEKTSNKPNTFKEGLYRPDVLAAGFCARRGMISNGTRIIWKIFPRTIFF